jgi:hypothetical protein
MAEVTEERDVERAVRQAAERRAADAERRAADAEAEVQRLREQMLRLQEEEGQPDAH